LSSVLECKLRGLDDLELSRTGEYKGYNGSPRSRFALLKAPIKTILPLSMA